MLSNNEISWLFKNLLDNLTTNHNTSSLYKSGDDIRIILQLCQKIIPSIIINRNFFLILCVDTLSNAKG